MNCQCSEVTANNASDVNRLIGDNCHRIAVRGNDAPDIYSFIQEKGASTFVNWLTRWTDGPGLFLNGLRSLHTARTKYHVANIKRCGTQVTSFTMHRNGTC